MTEPADERTAFRVAEIQRPARLVWAKPDSTWSWLLTPEGAGGTRLVTRLRALRRRSPPATVRDAHGGRGLPHDAPHVAGCRRPGRAPAYQRVRDALWPAPYQSVLVPTRFGSSHVLISGPPLLALPGAGLSATSWYPNVSALAGRFRVYAADLIFDRGRGTQTTPVRGARDCAAWAAELLDAVGVGRCSVVGLSQGGWVAASLASRHPSRVDRLALLAPAGALRRFRAPFWLLFRGAQDLLPRGDPRKRAARVFSMVGLQPPEPYFDQVALDHSTSVSNARRPSRRCCPMRR
jgi:pimeloyl-ACP methyl ester carboxylesterase